MSKKKPDLSSIKKKIADEEGPPIPQSRPEEKPQMPPETMAQIQEYAKAAEELRKSDEEEEKLNKIALDEVTDEESAAYVGQDDPVFYRNTPSDNPEIRKLIEAKCSGMDFSDLVLTGRVHQDVPILRDKLVVRYRSLLAAENFWIERRAEGEAKTDWGIRSWMGYARLVLSLESVNNNDFAALGKTEIDEIDRELFAEKFKKVMNMGEKLVELLLIHLNWFNDRVDRLYSDDFEQLKNG